MRHRLLLILVFAVVFAALAVGIHTATQSNTLGTDFYIFYRAGQTALFEHANPYSDQMGLEMQLAIFKHPALPGQDQLRFAYPPYVLLPVLPFLTLNFSWAQAIWMALLLLALFSAIALVYPGAPLWISISFLLFYPVAFGWILGNFAVPIAAGVLLLFKIFTTSPRLSRPAQIGFGLMMGWMTAKPQFVWLFAILFLVMAFKQRWWMFLAAFATGVAAFLAISFMIVPGWPALWLEVLPKYTQYNHSDLILSVLLGDLLPQAFILPVTIGLVILLVACTAWLMRSWWRGQLDDLLLLAWCGLMTYALHPRGTAYEHITYLLPLVMWACLQAKNQKGAVLFFWFISLAASWTVFIINTQPWAPDSILEWPWLLAAAWVGWLFWRRRGLMGSLQPEIQPK